VRSIGSLHYMASSIGSRDSMASGIGSRDNMASGIGSRDNMASYRPDSSVGGNRVDSSVGGNRADTGNNIIDSSDMVDSSIGGNWNSSGVDSSRISISITLSNGVDGSMVHSRDGGYRADSRVGGYRSDSRVGRHRADSRVGRHRADSRVGRHGSDSRVGRYRADSRVGGHRADRSNGSYNIVDSSNMVDSSIGGNWNSSGVDSSRISISITLSNGVNNRGSVQAIVGGVGSERSEEGGAVGQWVVVNSRHRYTGVHNLRFRLSEGNSGQSENSKHLHIGTKCR